MENLKEQTILELTRDMKTVELLEQTAYNWNVAVSRMEQINKEREEGLYDDDGVEAMGVFNRMERVGTMLFALNERPQALLLQGFRRLLAEMNDDHRMDAELTAMLSPKASELRVDRPTFWDRLRTTYLRLGKQEADNSVYVRKLFQTHYLPNMDDEDYLKWMKTLAEPAKEDEEHLDEQQEMIGELAYLGGNIGKVAAGSRQLMAMGLLVMQQTAQLMSQICDISQMDDDAVNDLFEAAKKDLLESEGWGEYWSNHLRHLEMRGGLKEELKKDQQEVESKLLDVHHYLYNKWNESPDAFGQALKRQKMSDDDLLKLLFLLAKKDAIALEQEEPDKRRETMENNALEAAMKLRELADDKYYDDYEDTWRQIVRCKPIAALLTEFNSSKYNQGFNMMCLCKIVGYLHREYHFYGSHSPEDMGKFMSDKYVKNSRDTFANYIKKKDTMLNEQCFKELDAIVKKE